MFNSLGLMKQLLVSRDVRAIGGTIFNNNPGFDCIIKTGLLNLATLQSLKSSIAANNCRPWRGLE